VKNENQLRKNLLICGDNLNALDDLIKKGIQADLIYLDPPFFSNKHYEVVWGDEAEVRSFKDRWAGGINVYIEWMKERVLKLHDVLKDTGSFYLHCDWHASHYLKVMLDEVFGYKNFQNEIIWKRSHSRSSISKIFRRAHDIVFFYTKSDEYIFNMHFRKLSEASKRIYIKRDEHGLYRLVPLLVSGRRGGETGKPWKGIDPNPRGKEGMHWVTMPSKLEAYEKKGLIVWPDKPGGAPNLKYYLKDNAGVPVNDIWDDIPIIQSSSSEGMGYPTQKPESLLERIIKVSSNKDDIVLDPFCGCGTAMAVSQRLGRKWIGIDISPTAIVLIEKRLGKLGAVKSKDFDVIGMPTTLSHLRNLEPFEFQNWVINEMHAKQSKKLSSDFGLDGYYDKTIFTERAGIQVKQSENVGRNVVDNFETALSRGKFSKGFIVAFSFSKGANEEAARAKGEGLEIRLIKVEDLLLGKVKI
jgi:DNA modification methylase